MSKQRQNISNEMLSMITEQASRVAIEAYKQQGKREEKEKFDRRLNNTKLLLTHYREFSEYNDNAIYKMYGDLDDDLMNIIDMMEGRGDYDNRIESIEKGVLRTRIIMSHVNSMLSVYKQNCECSPNPEDMRRYRVIDWLYLNIERKTVQEVAEIEEIAERTVYKDIRSACRRLTALIFGIDGFQR